MYEGNRFYTTFFLSIVFIWKQKLIFSIIRCKKNVLQIFFYHQSIDVEEINVLDQFLWYFCLDKNIVSKKNLVEKKHLFPSYHLDSMQQSWFFSKFDSFTHLNVNMVRIHQYIINWKMILPCFKQKKIVSPIVYYYSTHCIRSISLKMLFVVSWRFLCSIADYSRKQKKNFELESISFCMPDEINCLQVCVCVYVLICLSCDSSFFQNFFFIFAIFLYLACVFTHFYSFFLFCSSMIDC